MKPNTEMIFLYDAHGEEDKENPCEWHKTFNCRELYTLGPNYSFFNWGYRFSNAIAF